jgi:putative DNA primase/helicase
MKGKGMILRRIREGMYGVVCPRASLHTTGSADSTTVYYLGGYGGHTEPAFHCLHSHCTGVSQQEFRTALGLTDAYEEMRQAHAEKQENAGAEWADPQPLVTKAEALPYPVDALPAIVRGAVEEVRSYVLAPLPMVSTSCLAALSVCTMAHVDVRRNARLSGPTSLFTMVIADSGERKSTVDAEFTKPIRDYESRQAQECERGVRESKAALAAWHARRAGILDAIRNLAKKGGSTAELERELARLDCSEPVLMRVPRLLGDDATPEGLARRLKEGWPAVGIMSNEAGSVLGSHGMRPESIQRNLSRHNQLWDGQPISIDRGTAGRSITVRGARLALCLQVQLAALNAFIEDSRGLPRGMGYFSRFLLTHPPSTQGQRVYAEPPASTPGLSALHRAMGEILSLPVNMDADGALAPTMLELSASAKSAWIEFVNDVEVELGDGGEMVLVRDVAGKAGDNCARLAAIFHMIEHGQSGQIQPDAIERAAQIVTWHLNEARIFFGTIQLPTELADAVRLDEWLIAHCRRNDTTMVGKNHVRQYGPLRDGSALKTALAELTSLNRLRLSTAEDRTMIIALNPALVGNRP